MSDLGLYLARATEYCAETRSLIEDTINAINTQISMCYAKDEDARKYVIGLRLNVLRNALKSMGFSNEQLEAFASEKIPPEYRIIPVETVIRRYYRTYVRVPKGKETDRFVCEAARKMILEEQMDCLDQDPDMDIEDDDILSIAPDWEGAQDE